MSNSNLSNKPPSAAVSRSEPQTYKDEAAFLAQQAAAAKIAIGQTLMEMQKTAKEAGDLRWWTRHYPWAAVGTATLLGFFVAPILTRESPTPPQTTATRNGRAAAPSLLSSVIDLLRGVIVTAVTTALKNKGDQVEHPVTATGPEQ
jgi:hypothetical protein